MAETSQRPCPLHPAWTCSRSRPERAKSGGPERTTPTPPASRCRGATPTPPCKGEHHPMALIQPPMLTHGGTHPARAFRMMVRDLASGNQGVTEGNDLKVREWSTPGAGVRVGDGSAVVRG